MALLASWTSLHAQSATGDVQGAVLEQAGGPLAGAAVTAVERDSGVIRRTITDAEGLFTIAGLPIGSYRVTATLAGFAEVREDGVDVHVAQSARSRLVMRKAPLTDTIVLTPPGAGITAGQTTLGAVVTAGEVALLPLPSRDPLDFAGLTPFVPSERRGSGWGSFALPRDLGAVTVDGADDAQSLSGGSNRGGARSGYQFSQSTVSEIKIDVGAPRAEFGHGGTSFVSVVTRSGSDRFTGEVFERYRDGRLSATTPQQRRLGIDAPPLHANQFGASVGGPIVAGRSVFFAAYDGVRGRDENLVTLTLEPNLLLAALPGAERLATAASRWTQTTNQDVAFLRTDNRIGRSQRLAIRYNQRDLRGDGLERSGELIAADASGRSLVQTRSLIATFGAAIGHRTMNETRVSYGRERDLGTSRGSGPQADVREGGALILQVGGDASNPHDTVLERWQAADTLMITTGPHTIKGGADVEVIGVRDRSAANAAGSYVFQSIAGFGNGMPAGAAETYSQAFLPPGSTSLLVTPDSRSYAAFIQDSWRLGSAFMVDAGLRYDRQTFRFETPLRTDALAEAGLVTGAPASDSNNWGPRVGVAWTPASRYVVRGAYGVAYASTPPGFAAAVERYGSNDVQLLTLSGAAGDPVPAYPSSLASLPATPIARPLLVAFARDFEQPRVQHLTAGIEWEWMPRSRVNLSYVHATGRDLPQLVERNVGDAISASVVDAASGNTLPYLQYAPGPFTAFSRVLALESSGTSVYDGVSFEVRRDLHQGIHYRMAYTFAKTTDSGVVTSVMPLSVDDRLAAPADATRRTAQAPSDNDQRHRVLLDLVYLTDAFAGRYRGKTKAVLTDWRVAMAYELGSGRPYSAYVASDLNDDGNVVNDLAPGTTRNQFRRVKEGRLNARVARQFSLGHATATASADLFNAFNGVHNRDVDDVRYAAAGDSLFVNPRFGQTFTAGDPRMLQLGMAIGF